MLRLSWVVHGPIYGRFMGCAVNGFSFYVKVRLPGLPRLGIQRSGPTDPPKENGAP